MNDQQTYSVNEVIASLPQLHAQTIRIACVLCIEFEGDSIWHTPKAEQQPGYGSSLWATFDYESLGCDAQQLERFSGRYVLVTAKVDREMQGHLGLWPGSVVVNSIVKNKETQP